MSRITPFRESVLRRFFAGDVSARDLGSEAIACVERVDDHAINIHMKREKNDDFVLTRRMVLQLCEAAISDNLPYDALPTIAFILHAGSFTWEEDESAVGDTYRRVIECLSSPEINYPLSRQALEMFRGWLLGNETPSEPSIAVKTHNERLVHRTVSVFHE